MRVSVNFQFQTLQGRTHSFRWKSNLPQNIPRGVDLTASPSCLLNLLTIDLDKELKHEMSGEIATTNRRAQLTLREDTGRCMQS